MAGDTAYRTATNIVIGYVHDVYNTYFHILKKKKKKTETKDEKKYRKKIPSLI